MAQNITTNNAGTALPFLFTSLIEGIDAFGKGLVSVVEGIPGQTMYLPNFDISGTILQAYSPSAVTSGTSFDLDYTEPTSIALTDVMAQTASINPNAWRAVWADPAPDTSTTFTEMMLNPTVRDTFLQRVIQRVAKLNASQIWAGDTSVTGTSDIYDGVVTKLISTGGYVNAFETGDAAFSASNIAAYLERVYEYLVAQPALLTYPDTKIICSWETLNFYLNSEIATSGKGPLNSDIGDIQTGFRYKGVPVEPSNGFPNDVLLVTYTNPEPTQSCLHVGFRRRNDMEEYWFDRLADGSQNWGFKLAYSIGTAVTNVSNIILLDVRS